MTGILPGPINLTFLCVILVALAYSLRSENKLVWLGGAALFLSWCAAVVSTYLDNLLISFFTMVLCAIICFFPRNRELNIVATIYGFRIILLGLSEGGIISSDIMWAWTEIPLTIQILLVFLASRSRPDRIRDDIFVPRRFNNYIGWSRDNNLGCDKRR